MDPLTLGLIAGGAVFLLLAIVALFALRADFEFEQLDVRGGQLKGVIAAAVAKLLVRDSENIEIPLSMTLRKKGPLGAATPIAGGVTVTDLEWKLYLDSEHVSTIKDATSFHIGALARRIVLPVTASLHPPAGLLKTAGKLRKVRKEGGEIPLKISGFVEVKFWGITKRVPVEVSKALVLGEATPRMDELDWQKQLPDKEAPAHAEDTLDLQVVNPYSEETLEGNLRVDIVRPRRLRRAILVGSMAEDVTLAPAATHRRRLRVRLERPPEEKGDTRQKDAQGVRVRARVFWNGERLRLPEEPDVTTETDQADDPEDVEDANERRHTRLQIHRVRGAQEAGESTTHASIKRDEAPAMA